MAQLDYLRNVQHNFEFGDRLDIVGVFSKILLIVVPVVVAIALWRYRHILAFFFFRFFARLLSPRSRMVVEEYLVAKGILLNICLYSDKKVGKKIAHARVAEVVGGKMKLQLVHVEPTALNLKNKQVICFIKPFTYFGKKINSFVTFVSHVVKRGAVIKELSLSTPIGYRFVIRRKHRRQHVAREGTVRVKAWDGRKRNKFWLVKPDLQTVNNPARYGNKTRLSVENISAGGMRVLVLNPRGNLPPLNEGNQLVLRVSLWNTNTKKFSYFNVMGTIRSRFKGKGRSIGLGIQFTAEGNKVSGQYHWKILHGEVKSLVQFLEKNTE